MAVTEPNLTWSPAYSDAEGAERSTALFTEFFGGEPAGVWAAPGRVNVIGEHVDYNGGLCLPIDLPHRAFVAVRPRADRLVNLVSPETRDAVDHLDLDTVGPQGTPGAVRGWAAYLVGVAWALEQAGYGPIPGFDVALASCVPLGSGLSSSAALECAMAVSLDEIAGLGLVAGAPDGAAEEAGRSALVDICRRAENEVAGANTGGLDQSASLRCRAGNALELDCRDMSGRQIPFDLGAVGLEMLVIDTRAPHSHADGEYASRRADCEEAARILGVDLLVEVEDMGAALEALPTEVLRRRVRHVVSEIARTHAFVDVLESGPLTGDRLALAGALLDDSHDSLRDDYEVTSPELDTAVTAARMSGAHGARMTGGGFGGSAIALVDAGRGGEVAGAVARAFAAQGFREPHFLLATPEKAAARVR